MDLVFAYQLRFSLGAGTWLLFCGMKDEFLKRFAYGLSVEFSKSSFLRNGKLPPCQLTTVWSFLPKDATEKRSRDTKDLSILNQKYNLFMFVCFDFLEHCPDKIDSRIKPIQRGHFSFTYHTHAGSSLHLSVTKVFINFTEKDGKVHADEILPLRL